MRIGIKRETYLYFRLGLYFSLIRIALYLIDIQLGLE